MRNSSHWFLALMEISRAGVSKTSALVLDETLDWILFLLSGREFLSIAACSPCSVLWKDLNLVYYFSWSHLKLALGICSPWGEIYLQVFIGP